MCMAVDDDVRIVLTGEAFGCRTSELVAMTDVDAHAIDVDVDTLGEHRVSRRVRVAIDGSGRRDQFQLVENLRSTDGPGVEYHLHPLQRLVHSGPHQPVSIRDESNKMRCGIWHNSFYILGRTCRGYDWRSVWRCG